MKFENPMTHADWLVNNNSYLMLKLCQRIIRSHPRKGRLFAVACCHRIWHLLTDSRSRASVEMAAQYSDGLVSGEQLRVAYDAGEAAHGDAFKLKGKVGASAEWAAQFASSSNAWFAASRTSNFAYVAAGDPVIEPGPEKALQARLLRCIFGPLPFHSVTVEPSWLEWSRGVPKLAQTIYDEKCLGAAARTGRRFAGRRMHESRHSCSLSSSGAARPRLLGAGPDSGKVLITPVQSRLGIDRRSEL